jgi:hypothetical protein
MQREIPPICPGCGEPLQSNLQFGRLDAQDASAGGVTRFLVILLRIVRGIAPHRASACDPDFGGCACS